MTDTPEDRVVTVRNYGRDTRHFIRPSTYQCCDLAAHLANELVSLAPEIEHSVGVTATAIRSLCAHLDHHSAHAEDLTIRTVTRADFDSWELTQRFKQTATGTSTNYSYVVQLLALLRRIDDDDPGTLRSDLAARVRKPTRLPHLRPIGPTGYTRDERRQLIKAAKALVDQALRERPPAPPSHVTVALHVLLAAGTGEPSEVLRALTIDDLSAMPEPGTVDLPQTHDERLHRIAELDAAASYHLEFEKRRAHVRYDATYLRQDRLTHWTLTALLRLTSAARSNSSQRSLWLTQLRNGDIVEAPWNRTPSLRLADWAERYVDGEPLSQPITFRRIRKSVVAAEAGTNPIEYFTAQRRHSAQTFFDHYANSPVLIAQAGNIVLDSITELYNAAIEGPTVVTNDAAALLAQGQPAPPELDLDTHRLIAGELNGPLAACRDPLASPHAPEGTPCPTFANGECYRCPNAIITEAHLPGVIRLVRDLDPDTFGNLRTWAEHWRDIYLFLTERVLPQFSEDAIADATKKVEDVYLDAGFVNGHGALA